MALAESLLAATQLARVVQNILIAYQKGDITGDEFQEQWIDIRLRLRSAEDLWQELEQQDNDRPAKSSIF